MKEHLIGMWQLADYKVTYLDGKTMHPYGPQAAGLLVYDPQGWMAVQIMRPGIARFEVDDRWMGTSEEVQAAFNGYQAYFGRYTIDNEAKIVTHHVAGSTFPNYIDKKQARHFEFQDDCLVLSTPPMAFGGKTGTGRMIWQRLSDQVRV